MLLLFDRVTNVYLSIYPAHRTFLCLKAFQRLADNMILWSSKCLLSTPLYAMKQRRAVNGGHAPSLMAKHSSICSLPSLISLVLRGLEMAASDFVNSIIVFYFDQLQYNKCPSKPVMLPGVWVFFFKLKNLNFMKPAF